MKQLALLALALCVVAEAKITVYRNQDVLVHTLQSPALSKFLNAEVALTGDSARLSSGELKEASVEALQSSGAAKTFLQKLTFTVKGASGKSYECSIEAASTYTVHTSGGITSSELAGPDFKREIRCR